MKYKHYKISPFTYSLGLYFAVVILGVVKFFSMGSMLKYLAFLPIICSVFQLKNVGLSKSWVPVIAYYGFAILSLLWSVNPEESSNTAFAFFSFLLLLFVISSQKYNIKEIHFLKKSLLWSSRLSLLITWLFVSFAEGRLLIAEDVMAEDPNYLCAYFYFGIAYCVEDYFVKNNKSHRTIDIIEILVYLFTIFFTGSRGGLLGGIIVAVIVFIKAGNKKAKSSIITKLFFIGLFVLLVPVVGSMVDPEIMERFSKENLSETDGSGRFEIWEDALNAFSSYDFWSMLIGKGMGASREVAKLYNFGRVNVMHNVFLENLIGIGLIGTFLYLWSIFVFYKQSKKNTFALSVFVGMLVLSLSTSILYLKPSWNSMLFVLCVSLVSDRHNIFLK